MTPLAMIGAEKGANLLSNILTGAWNDHRQLKQQGKLNEQQMAYDKEMTNYNMLKQLEMWKATNYKAQMEQLKEAGLNPALMYAKGGAGGSTTVATSSSGKSQAPNAPIPFMGINPQTALLQAQKENIEADTKLKEVEATKKEGVDTKEKEANIELLGALKNNEVVKKEVNEQIREQEYVKTHIATVTMNNVVAQSKYQTEQMWEILQNQQMQNKITKETMEEQIGIVEQTWSNLIVQKKLMESNIDINNAQISKMIQELYLRVQELDLSKKHLELDQYLAGWETNWGNILGKEAIGVVKNILSLLPFMRTTKGRAVIEGFTPSTKKRY